MSCRLSAKWVTRRANGASSASSAGANVDRPTDNEVGVVVGNVLGTLGDDGIEDVPGVFAVVEEVEEPTCAGLKELSCRAHQRECQQRRW